MYFPCPQSNGGGAQFDAILLCVDRATSWIIAKAVLGEGFTGEKAANLLMDSGWGEVARNYTACRNTKTANDHLALSSK